MPQLQPDPNDYERATAIITHTTLSVSVSRTYPEYTMRERNALIVGVIDRLARMRGYAIRREYVDVEDGE